MSGKVGIAPCGHLGYHYTANYVACSVGCDSTSDERAETGPAPVGQQLCRLCGSPNVAVWDHEFDDGDRRMWSCRTCGKEFLASPGSAQP